MAPKKRRVKAESADAADPAWPALMDYIVPPASPDLIVERMRGDRVFA